MAGPIFFTGPGQQSPPSQAPGGYAAQGSPPQAQQVITAQSAAPMLLQQAPGQQIVAYDPGQSSQGPGISTVARGQSAPTAPVQARGQVQYQPPAQGGVPMQYGPPAQGGVPMQYGPPPQGGVPQVQLPVQGGVPQFQPPFQTGVPQGTPNLEQQVAILERRLSEVMNAAMSKEIFPEQERAGVVAYPDRYAFPMVYQAELKSSTGGFFGVDNSVCNALIQMDILNPIYLHSISFSLYKPVLGANVAPLGIYLPLSGAVNDLTIYAPLSPGVDYHGRDFQWQVTTSSDSMRWQTGWRPSTQVQSDHRKGYRLPAEHEIRRNETILIEARPLPIATAPDGQSWVLDVYLHLYKMLLRRS